MLFHANYFLPLVFLLGCWFPAAFAIPKIKLRPEHKKFVLVVYAKTRAVIKKQPLLTGILIGAGTIYVYHSATKPKPNKQNLPEPFRDVTANSFIDLVKAFFSQNTACKLHHIASHQVATSKKSLKPFVIYKGTNTEFQKIQGLDPKADHPIVSCYQITDKAALKELQNDLVAGLKKIKETLKKQAPASAHFTIHKSHLSWFFWKSLVIRTYPAAASSQANSGLVDENRFLSGAKIMGSTQNIDTDDFLELAQSFQMQLSSDVIVTNKQPIELVINLVPDTNTRDIFTQGIELVRIRCTGSIIDLSALL